MKIAYFDCPSGAAGDMIMAALVDAGASLDALRSELRKLPLEGWELVGREVRKGAFRATKVDVEIDPHAHPHHRALGDVLALLEQSGLGAAVREKAARVFTRLADAEARAHGTTRDRVRFHDVGAVDAIVDVTGACVGLELLGVQAVHVSALPLGGGVVDGPHGKMPVPAPGTAELLRGFPVVDTGVKAELVTPTGAAILTTLALSAGRMPAMTVAAVGYGAGTRDLSRVLFEETSTIGVRWSERRRTRLQRESVTLATAYGAIPFKVSRLGGRVVTVTPEFADVARIAREKSLPVREVLDQARADGRRLLGG